MPQLDFSDGLEATSVFVGVHRWFFSVFAMTGPPGEARTPRQHHASGYRATSKT
jgi:hypothetical protein